MQISARVENREGSHQVSLRTDNHVHTLDIPPKSTGFGSSANGGELLFLALATCYCNDLYREAAKRSIRLQRIEVEVKGDFGAEGEPARNVTYHARVEAQASEAEIRALLQQTDRVAEIQNSLRAATPVTLDQIEAVSV
jgi:organic hydroperoxide reductase OsmC/OhrA